MNRRGEDAGAVSVFVFLLAIFIVLYVMFIPEDARTDLFDASDYTSSDSNSNNKYDDSDLILEDNPGKLTPEGNDYFEYNMDTITLFSDSQPGVIKSENAFIVRKSWFSERTKEVLFSIDDQTSNLLLSFNVEKADGLLSIYLNNDLIYEKEIKSYNVDSITLDEEILKEKNSLVFEVSSGHLTSNLYSITDLKIVGETLDTSKQQAELSFFIPEDRDAIQSATIKFVPECELEEVGTLTINLNNKRVFSAIPECGRLNSQTISPEFLKDGTNTISFSTTEGSYQIDNTKVRTETKEKNFPTYYFYVDEDLYRNITSRRASEYINASFEFLVPEDNYIDLQVSVNDRRFGIYQRNRTFSKDISDLIEEGNNAIKLIPEEVVEIVDFRLTVEEDD